MSVWTIANQKGGVGKTTTAVTLAGIAAERGLPVLLIDLDPHASATHYLRAADSDGAMALLRGEAATPMACCVPGIQVLGAGAALAAIERQHGGNGMGRRLSQGLAALRERFDPVIIDTPPMLGTLLINALAAADALIVPVQTDPLALHGLEGLMRTLAMMRQAGAQVPEPLMLPTLMDRRVKISHETLDQLKSRWGAAVFDGGVVPMDTRIREAARDGRTLNSAAPYRHATATYEALFERLHQPAPEAA